MTTHPKRLPILGVDADLATRFPMPLVPDGWYGILRSRELGSSRPVALRAFDRDWAAFRGADGAPAVVAAHCPHLGAHLGHGGRVEHGELVCPFHAWRYAADGSCTSAPGCPRAPRIRLETLPTCERNGVVFAWHSAAGEASTYEIPADPLHDPSRLGLVLEHRVRVACHVQELRENLGDESHFTVVHERPLAAPPVFTPDGPRARLRFAATIPWLVGLSLPAEVEMIGPGVAFFRIGGWARSSVLALTTPIDARSSELRLLFAAADVFGLPGTRLLQAPILRLIGAADVRQEAAIWGHKRYLARPIYLPHERTQRRIRDWYRQFYENQKAPKSEDP